MRNKNTESRSVQESRSNPSFHTRLIRSSQIPKDFFTVPRTVGCRESQNCDEKRIFKEFKSMFRMRRNLQSLALKLSIRTEAQDSMEVEPSEKESCEIKFPSLHLKRQFSEGILGKKKLLKNSFVSESRYWKLNSTFLMIFIKVIEMFLMLSNSEIYLKKY